MNSPDPTKTTKNCTYKKYRPAVWLPQNQYHKSEGLPPKNLKTEESDH